MITTLDRPPRILLGITGSVAAVKGPELALSLAQELNAEVIVLLTRAGMNFWIKAEEYNGLIWNDYQDFRSKEEEIWKNGDEGVEDGPCRGRITMYEYHEEWKGWQTLGDPVLHIQLRDWADIAVVAPLSAHSLAKIATGLCDDPLSCVLRAWDLGYHATRPGKPLVLAPAMNTAMWEHPLTRTQLDTVKGFWNLRQEECKIKVVDPQVKILACGEEGTGAMASVSDIITATRSTLQF